MPPKPAPLSIVDIASAAINGRSAAATLAGSAEKTAAHVAAHTAGSLAPVSSRLVIRICCDPVRIAGLSAMCSFGLLTCLAVIQL